MRTYIRATTVPKIRYCRREPVNWERVFYLLVFPLLCWLAILIGIGAALFAE